MADISVINSPARHRYEARIDGVLAGVALYREERDAVVFTHTEVMPAFEGHGVGGVLARGALDDVRHRGRRVVALCPFIAAWIAKHPRYQDLLVA
ncbi:GNAT family N-acetyltransferase [Nostocoides sp. HKS02]|uniref:GNAT family N-acetyltransferase n=1 Tax=Nostocoides sp. HKS02 TaxID=1813880 RepID=UPI0012B4F93A|nr:GNAT family N-acetyltransferase [Tetrasphaera sp. HKS02]QGN56716.1 GNAT family N-acetyltransferase [Tetrasphaera sp. HKS02]